MTCIPPSIVGVTVVSDTRQATHLFGVAVFLVDDDDFAIYPFADAGNHRPLKEAWLALNMADYILVANKWSLDMLHRFSTVLQPKLADAIDLQKVSRAMEPQHRHHSLDACAERLNLRRTAYKGAPVWTEAAMDHVIQDAIILHELYKHLNAARQ